MRYTNLASLAAGIALAAGLLAGCSSSPPQDRVVAVTPPVVAVTPPPPPNATVAGSNANAQTFQAQIGMTPLEAQGIMHLQSFAGDVCIADRDGANGELSHCICQQTNCNCQTTGNACNP